MKDIKTLSTKVSDALHVVVRYRVFLFFLLLAGTYGFLIFRISVLNNAEPGASRNATTQTQATPIPHIDANVVKQLQQLQDNSVSVQALFNQARNNPFQE